MANERGQSIRIIRTRWHGCQFRSKLEAKWAIVFELMGLEWSYEPEGFMVGNVWYEPDFLVAGFDGRGEGWSFIEVKGNMKDPDRRKIRAISKFFPVYVVGDIPWSDPLDDQFDKWSDESEFHSFEYIDGDYFGAAIGVNKDGYPELFGYDSNYTRDCNKHTTTLCFEAARYAQFDHGNKPEHQDEYRVAKNNVSLLRLSSNHKRKGHTMPRLSKAWNQIEESTGQFSDIEPGAYVLVITKVDSMDSKQYARIYWDVAEGEHKGAYAQSQYPPSDVLSWKDNALGMLKHKLHVLADSNAGFQPTVAFDNDDWKQFVGKRFGAVVRRRLYTAGPNSKTPGADRTAIEVAAWLTPAQVAAHEYSDSLLNDRDQRDKAQQSATQQPVVQAPADFGAAPMGVYDEDVPF